MSDERAAIRMGEVRGRHRAPEEAILDGTPSDFLLVATGALLPVAGAAPVQVGNRFDLVLDSDDPRFAAINEAFNTGSAIEVGGMRCRVHDIAVELVARDVYAARVAATERGLDAMHPSIWDEIRAERARQDAEWGGPEHDDLHSPLTFLAVLVKHTGKLAHEVMGMGSLESAAGVRRRLVVVAALAVAFIEALDRARARNTD